MVDRISPEVRSRVMARIRLRNTGPELALRRALWAAGFHYRLKTKQALPGRPDIVFVGAKVAVFVDGCFWHGCPEHGHQPKSRLEYWGPKIERNRRRDAEANAALSAMGWRVLRFWEHQIRADLPYCIAKVTRAVKPCRA